MKLHEFIHDTLTQIAMGVQNANETFAEIGLAAQANPPGAESSSKGGTTYQSVSNVQLIKFDIAIEVDESAQNTTGAKAGFNIKVLSGSIGTDRLKSNERSTVQRLEFAIPLKLTRPSHGG